MQILTKEQKEAATKLFDEWREDHRRNKLDRRAGKRLGSHPFAVVDAEGNVVHSDRAAACLSSLYRNNLKSKSPVLFHMLMLEEFMSGNGYAKDDYILRYVEWSCRNQLLKPFILRHTRAERLKFGVPIALEGVPRNLPLLASTHIRYMWDGHNTKFITNIPNIREMFPRLKWSEVFVLATCLSSVTSNDIQVRLTSDAHSAFGSRSSLKAIQDYSQQRFNHKKMDSEKLLLVSPNRGLGIEFMFSRYSEGASFNDHIQKILKEKKILARNDWGGAFIKKKNLNTVVALIVKELRK